MALASKPACELALGIRCCGLTVVRKKQMWYDERYSKVTKSRVVLSCLSTQTAEE